MPDPINATAGEPVAPSDAATEMPLVGRRAATRDPHVLLTGRPPAEEYLGIAQQAAQGSSFDVRALMAEWRRACDHVAVLMQQEAAIADGVSVNPLPGELSQLAAAYLADPMVVRSFSVVPVDVMMVELDKLVVFQKVINLRYAQQLGTVLDKDMTPEALMRFCLGIEQPRPPVRVLQSAQNAYTFVSESLDLRFLDIADLDPKDVRGFTPQGEAARAVAIFIGYGTNALNVVNVSGRVVLNNGSHRAYALRAAGLMHVPAIVQQVSHPEELAFFPALKENADVYLAAPRPPLLKDYFDPQLHTVIDLPRRLRQVRVTFGVEPTDVPAMD